MAVDWRERTESRAVSGAPSLEMQFVLSGVIDDVAAWSYALGNTSPIRIAAGQTVYRQIKDIKLDHRGFGLWNISVPYAPNNEQAGSFDFDFDTQGGTLRITQSKATQTFPAGGPDHKGAIDVDGTEVRGADIIIPALRLNYTFRHPLGVMNEARAVALARATGKTNSVAWHGFAAGECLFLGAQGKSGTTSESSVTYYVAASENLTNQTIGAIANVNKKGWEIAWVSYEPADDAGRPARRAQWIYVEQVYDSMNFAAVLGF